MQVFFKVFQLSARARTHRRNAEDENANGAVATAMVNEGTTSLVPSAVEAVVFDPSEASKLNGGLVDAVVRIVNAAYQVGEAGIMRDEQNFQRTDARSVQELLQAGTLLLLFDATQGRNFPPPTDVISDDSLGSNKVCDVGTVSPKTGQLERNIRPANSCSD